MKYSMPVYHLSPAASVQAAPWQRAPAATSCASLQVNHIPALLIKIGALVVRHFRAITFQPAEVAIMAQMCRTSVPEGAVSARKAKHLICCPLQAMLAPNGMSLEKCRMKRLDLFFRRSERFRIQEGGVESYAQNT